MDENIKKRVRRTAEQRAEDIDAKIQEKTQAIASLEEKRAAAMAEFDKKAAGIKEGIKKLEAKKKDILAPKAGKPHRRTKKQKIQELILAANKSGMTPEEIAEKLDFQLEK